MPDLRIAFVQDLVDKCLLIMPEFLGVKLYTYQLEMADRIFFSLLYGDAEELTIEAARQCLDGDTVVFRRNGTACRLRDHEEAWSTGIKEVSRYKVRGGAEITATANHLVMAEKGWTRVGDLAVGDKVCVMAGEWDQWTGAQEYGRTILRGRWRNPQNVTVEVTDALARFLGYFITDGSYRPGQSAKFTNTSWKYLTEMAALSEKIWGVEPEWYPKGKGFDLIFSTTSKSSFNNPLRDTLAAISWDNDFPLDVFEWPKAQLGEFVNRAWSGDGTVRVSSGCYPDIFLACGNSEIYARYWQALLAKLGIASTIKREWMKKGTGTFHRLVVGGGIANAQKFLELTGDIYGKEAGCRKVRSIIDEHAPLPETITWNCPGFQRHCFGRRGGPKFSTCIRCNSPRAQISRFGSSFQQDPYVGRHKGEDGESLAFAPIVSITELGEREVFDVSYPHKDWFIAQGVKVHNCGKSESLADISAVAMVIFPKLAVLFPEDPVIKKFLHGIQIGVFAPIDEQADTIFGRIEDRLTSKEATAFLQNPDINDSVRRSGNELTTASGSVCRRQTAHAKAKIESKTYHLIILDEAQDADSTKVKKCVAKGTPIWLPDGTIRPVEEVVAENLPVISYTKGWDLQPVRKGGNAARQRDRTIGKPVSTFPSAWHSNGVQDVYCITTASGRSVEATALHRWPSRRRGSNSNCPIERTTSQLHVGDQLALSLRAHFFGTDGEYEEGYFVGAMLGDGGLTGSRPQFSAHADGGLDRVLLFAAKLGVTAELNCPVKPDGMLDIRLTVPREFGGGNTYNSNPLTELLRYHKVWGLKGPLKALQRMDYSKDFFRGWVEGLIDTDGCVENKTGKCVSFANSSEQLTRQLSDVLLRFGIYSNVWHYEQETDFGHSSMWGLRVKSARHIEMFAEEFDLANEEKTRKLLELATKSRAKRSRRSVHYEKGAYAADDPEGIIYDRIVSITPVGKKPTYCITVPSELWVMNGLVSLNSLHPMAVATAGTIVKVGTPAAYKSDFYEAILRNKRRSKSHGKANHFSYDWRRAARENPYYATSIKKEKNRLGEDSDEFLLSYELHWLLERGMFITEELLEELGDKSMEVKPYYADSAIVIGIDVARTHDSTVATAVWVDWSNPDEFGLYTHRVLNWLELHGENWESQYRQLCDFVSHYRVLRIGVDGQGMGGPVAERLQVLLPNIEVISLGMNPIDQSERWQHLMQLMQRRLIGWPAHARTRRTVQFKRFVQQMADVEKEYRGKYLLVSAPKNEKNAHDDYIDSLALACALTCDFGQTLEVEQWSSNPLLERGMGALR